MVRYLLVVAALVACGGGDKHPHKPAPKDDQASKPPPPETEADRETKRHALALAIVPDGSSCLPVALKDDSAPRLEFAAVDGGKGVEVCAIDTDRSRLLGAVGCWKVALDTGALTYTDAAPLPGSNIDVLLDDRCARGFCMPKEAKIAGIKIAHMSWSLDGKKVAVLVGDDVHIFDAADKSHTSSFPIRGDKGLTNDPIAVHFIGDTIFVEGADQGPYAAVWQFKADGTAVGPLVGIGGKDPLSTYHGSFSLLDPDHVGVAERGMETLTSFEISTGRRAKAVRKIGKLACKGDEVDAFWHDGDKVTDKCKDSIAKEYGALMGATAVMGKTNLLVMLRGDRLGEFGVLDPKLLAEKRSIKMPWCDNAKKSAGQ
ncbi:MAG TPA: hypothetical protein VMJ10_20745 [Kofleriaceae bacterium]|nr:hypothetical protein [Kofleriaceae bacterium]